MEKPLKKTRIVIIPNPNQLILLRDLQKELCSVPTFPIYVECDELKSLNDKVTNAEPEGIFTETKIYLGINMEVNGKKCSGRIELGENKGNFQKTQSNSKDIPTNFSQKPLSESGLKKLSPFRIVELKSEHFENGLKWKILREKWVKTGKAAT